MKTYQIGDKKFTMEKLVMGQIEHLTRRLETMSDFELSVPGVLSVVAKRTDVLACVLLPDGTKRGELVKQLDNGETKETEAFLRANLDLELLVTVVTDFFDFIPMSQLLAAVDSVKSKVTKGFNLSEPSPSSSKPSTLSSPVGASATPNECAPLLHPTMSGRG